MSAFFCFFWMKIFLNFFLFLVPCFLCKIIAKPCSAVRRNLTWSIRIVKYYGALNPPKNYCREEMKGSSFLQTQHRFLTLSSVSTTKILLVYTTATTTSITNIAEQLFLEFQDVQEKNKNIGCCDSCNGFISYNIYFKNEMMQDHTHI